MGKSKKKDSKPVVAKAKAKAPEPEVEIDDLDDSPVASGADVIGEENMPVSEGDSVPYVGDHAALVPLLHRLLDTVNIKTAIPAIAESCSCGASLSIAESVPEADRKRMHNAFVRQHKPCLPAAE